MGDSVRDNMFSGVVWSFIRQASLQVFAFIQGIILARLLDPSDYGLLAMPAIFMAISGCFIDSGFATALVRKKDRTAIDYSTVFVTTICLTAFFAIVLCATSPLIADFYGEPLLVKIICINSLLLFLNSFLSIQSTRLTIKMDFKASNIFRVITNVTIGIVSIICALMGMGIWSLVWPNFIMPFLNGYLYWRHDPWFPGFKFSWKVWREFFGFGSKLLVSNLITTIYDHIYPLVVGKKFSATSLGYYAKAQNYASLPPYTLGSIIGPTAYPVLCSIIDDEIRLYNVYRKLIRLFSFLVFPFTIGVIVLAHPIIIVLITEKWEPCVKFLQILAVAYIFVPLNMVCLDMFKVKGRSDLFLKIELYKKLMGIGVLIISIPFGLEIMCWGQVVVSCIGMAVNIYYMKQVFNMSLKTQLFDIIPHLLYSISMGGVIYLVVFNVKVEWVSLLLGIIVGGIYYFCVSKMRRSTELDYILNIIKEKVLCNKRDESRID